MQDTKKIKASKKPYKSKKKLLENRIKSSKDVVSGSRLSLPELEKPNPSATKKSLKVQDQKEPTKDTKSNQNILSENLIRELSKNFIKNYKTINNYFPKTYNTSISAVDSRKLPSKFYNKTNKKLVKNSFLNSTSHNSSFASQNNSFLNSTSQNNSFLNSTSQNSSLFIPTENTYKNQSNSYYESIIKNMIQPGGKTRVYLAGKEREVDSTKIVERIEKQGGVVPMFQAGGMITKPTLGLLGEAGPEMVSPIKSMMSMANPIANNAVTAVSGAVKSATGFVKTAASSYHGLMKSAASSYVSNAKEMITDPVGSIKKKFNSISNFFGFGGGNSENTNNNISNQTNNNIQTQNMQGTVTKNQNLPAAVNALEKKTNNTINNITNNQQKIQTDPSKEAPYGGNDFTVNRPTQPNTNTSESGVDMGSGSKSFERFFANKNFSVPEWRQRMG